MTAITPLEFVHKKGIFGEHHKKNESDLLKISELKNLTIIQVVQYKRSKVNIDEVTNLLTHIIRSKKTGIYNLVTGKIYSFHYLAKKIIKLTGSNSKIITTKRVGTMPHNGYRAFNRRKLNKEFPKLKKISFDTGIKKMLKEKM